MGHTARLLCASTSSRELHLVPITTYLSLSQACRIPAQWHQCHKSQTLVDLHWQSEYGVALADFCKDCHDSFTQSAFPDQACRGLSGGWADTSVAEGHCCGATCWCIKMLPTIAWREQPLHGMLLSWAGSVSSCTPLAVDVRLKPKHCCPAAIKETWLLRGLTQAKLLSHCASSRTGRGSLAAGRAACEAEDPAGSACEPFCSSRSVAFLRFGPVMCKSYAASIRFHLFVSPVP